MKLRNKKMNTHLSKRIVLVLTLALAAGALLVKQPIVSASDPGSGDWPMWGGTPDRNMISRMKDKKEREVGG